jgi:hypothetical protein
MTAVLTPPDRHAWGSMPGWDVVADMTPPELVQRRWIEVLRRRIVTALVLVTVVCAAGLGYAAVQQRVARDEAAAADDRTAQLDRSADRYVGITEMETIVSGIDRQVAALLADEVDVPRTIAAINAALPSSMTIQNMSVNLVPEGSTDGSDGLDATGRPTVGTVEIGGAGRSLDDLPAFVDRLATIRGVADVLPDSNEVSGGRSQYSVSLRLTDRLHTHRFDVPEGGVK